MKPPLIHDEKRESDVQAVCLAILNKGIYSTGDYGMGGECPFCFSPCCYDDDIKDIKHKSDCVYLIAKDLQTNF